MPTVFKLFPVDSEVDVDGNYLSSKARWRTANTIVLSGEDEVMLLSPSAETTIHSTASCSLSFTVTGQFFAGFFSLIVTSYVDCCDKG